MKIEKIVAREILDSRGNPTVEVDVVLESGIMDVRLFRQVLPQVNMKHSNFVMVTSNVTVAKAYKRRWTM